MNRTMIISRFFGGLLAILALLSVFPALAAPRPDESKPPAAKPEPRTFAVSGFPVIATRATEYSWLGVGLGDDLATRLARCDQHLFQVERLQFNEVLHAQQVEMLTQGVSAAVEPEVAERKRLMGLAQVTRTSYQGQKWGAQYLIVGSLWLEGAYPQDQSRLKANVRLVNVATGQIVSSIQASSYGNESGYVLLQEQLAEQLAERLGVPANKRVRVRDYRLEGGEVYRRFAQAREALYQGRYQEAKTLSEQADAAGARQLLPQIWETNRQAHERLVQAVSEKDKAYLLNRERRQQVEVRKREVQELAALTHFEDGEQYRIEAETFKRFGDGVETEKRYQQALTAYDEYLRNTQNGLVRWEAYMPDVSSTFFSEDMVGVMSNDHRLWVLDAMTGEKRWEIKVKPGIKNLVLSDRLIYTVSEDHQLRALDAMTGEERWEIQVKSGIKNLKLWDGLLFTVSEDHQLRALDANNGKQQWEISIGSGIEDPVISDGFIYVVSKDLHHLQALDARNGKQRWIVDAEVSLSSNISVADGIVYALSGSGWSEPELYAFDAKTGKFLWYSSKQIDSYIVMDGVVYGMSKDGYLWSFDAKKGKLRWSAKTRYFGGDLVAFSDGIIYSNAFGSLQAFDSKKGKELWSFLTRYSLELPGHAPIILNKIAYVNSDYGYLHALNTKDGTEIWSLEGSMVHQTKESIYIERDNSMLSINRSLAQQYRLNPTFYEALSTKAIILEKTNLPSYAFRVLNRKWRETKQATKNDISLLNKLLPQLQLSLYAQDAIKWRISMERVQKPSWESNASTPFLGSIEVANETVYLATQCSLRAFHAKTGKKRWDFQASCSDDSTVRIPGVMQDIIYIASSIGMWALDIETGKVRWHYSDDLHDISSPVIVDRSVYVGASGKLRAFDGGTGGVRWKIDVEIDTSVTPQVVKGVIYVVSHHGDLCAFNAKTGKKLWTVGTGANRPNGVRSMLVVDGIVYTILNKWPESDYIYAFDAETGKQRWFIDAQLLNTSVTIVDGTVYIAGSPTKSNSVNLRAFDAKTGTPRWAGDTEFGEPSALVVANGIAYITSAFGLLAFNTNTGQLRWEYQNSSVSVLAVEEGIVYASIGDNRLQAFDANTGQLRWEFQSGDPVWNISQDAIGKAVNGVVYAGTSDGYLRAFSVSTILSGQYTPDIVWANDEQFYSYLIWGKIGLAARKIEEGEDMESVLKQSALDREELAAGLDQLLAGIPYHSVGALAEDPGKLRPPWFTVATQKASQSVRPAVAFYLNRAAKDEEDRPAYLAEAKRLAPDVDLAPWGLK